MKFPYTLFTLFITLSSFCVAQDQSISSPHIEKQLNMLLSKMTLKEKVGQTCQITLEVLLLRDSSGTVMEPIQSRCSIS